MTTILRSCRDGDLIRLQSLLQTAQQKSQEEGSQPVPSNAEMLQVAARHGCSDIVRYLVYNHPHPSNSITIDPPLIKAACDGGLEVYSILFAYDPTIIHVNLGHMGDALSLAAMKPNLPLLRFLLSHGANPATSHFLNTPLLAAAAAHSSEQVVGCLLEHGAGAGALPGWADAIVAALRVRRLGMIEVLLGSGNDLNAVIAGASDCQGADIDSGPILHIAVSQGYKDGVVLLMKYGADPSIKDARGHTALMRAKEVGNQDIVDCLLGAIKQTTK